MRELRESLIPNWKLHRSRGVSTDPCRITLGCGWKEAGLVVLDRRYYYSHFILPRYGDLHIQLRDRYDQPVEVFLNCLL